MDLGGLLNPAGGFDFPGTYSNEPSSEPIDLVLPDFTNYDFWFDNGSDSMQYEASQDAGFNQAQQFEAEATANDPEHRNQGNTVNGAVLLEFADEARNCYGMVGHCIPYYKLD